MTEKLIITPEKIINTVSTQAKWLVDSIRAFKQGRIEVLDVDLSDCDPFGNEQVAHALSGWKRIRHGGPFGDLLRLVKGDILYREQDIPLVLSEMRMKGQR